MSEPVYEKHGITEIFDNDKQAEEVMWYLLYLLGGKVVIPVESEFWAEAVPHGDDMRIVLRKEDGKLVLVAESLQWQ